MHATPRTSRTACAPFSAPLIDVLGNFINGFHDGIACRQMEEAHANDMPKVGIATHTQMHSFPQQQRVAPRRIGH